MFNYGVCVVLQSNSAKVIYAVSQFIPVVIFNYLFRHRFHAQSVIYANFVVLLSFPAVFQFVPASFTCPECDLREFLGTSILPCGVPILAGCIRWFHAVFRC